MHYGDPYIGRKILPISEIQKLARDRDRDRRLLGAVMESVVVLSLLAPPVAIPKLKRKDGKVL